MPPDEIENLIFLESCLEELDKALGRFVTALGKPLLILEKGQERFRYKSPDSKLFQVLKFVRIISSLFACLNLLRKGFTQEIGVLVRTVHDFQDQIRFIQEALESGTPTAHQQREIENFFEEDVLSLEERLGNVQKKGYVPRKKRIASQAMAFEKLQNPSVTVKQLNILEDAYSGYVHGHYPCIMELYDGALDGVGERFRTRGMLGTPKIKPFRWQLASEIHNALNTAYVISKNFRFDKLAERLLALRKLLGDSQSYKDTNFY